MLRFADNYYQTLTSETGATLMPNGRDIPDLPPAERNKIPVNGIFPPNIAGLNFPRDAAGNILGNPNIRFDLNTVPGFAQVSDPHGEIVKRYARSVDANVPNDFNTTVVIDPNGNVYEYRESYSKGWYYSVLGGGKPARDYTTGTRVPISWDNTLQARSRGDFAVPTLFNGNFRCRV